MKQVFYLPREIIFYLTGVADALYPLCLAAAGTAAKFTRHSRPWRVAGLQTRGSLLI
jgi:hypothetical protein